MITEPNFRLDGFVARDLASQHAEESLWPGDCTVLAEHHSADRTQSFLVVHDGSVTWGVPGEPQLVAVKITRDVADRTFRFEATSHAAAPFAQHWLIERGCQPGEIHLIKGEFSAPADDLTLRIEEQICASGDRYEVIETCTSDFDDECETWTLVRDSSPSAGPFPVRVFLEQADLDAGTYTLRESAFVDAETAGAWLDKRDGPLPEPPWHRTSASLLGRAALARSAAGAAAVPVPAKAAAQAPFPTVTCRRSR